MDCLSNGHRTCVRLVANAWVRCNVPPTTRSQKNREEKRVDATENTTEFGASEENSVDDTLRMMGTDPGRAQSESRQRTTFENCSTRNDSGGSVTNP